MTVSPGGQNGSSDASGNYLIDGLTPGSRTITVTGTPAGCFRPAPRTVQVAAGATASANFDVVCRRIVYAQFLGGPDGEEIFVINADGTGQTRLTTTGGNNFDPSWSPDGSQIVFNDDGEIVVMNADGGGRHALTNDAFFDLEPEWSRDGSRIAFVSFRGGNTDIWTINADGTGQTQLTSTPGSERDPSWSPDGGTLAFGKAADIYVMPASVGGTQTKLTTNPFADSNPVWSPDGSRIAYTANSEADDGHGSADHSYEIFTMNPDGSGQTQVTHDDFFDLQPARSPDGSLLVYSSYAPGTPSLRLVGAAGGPSTTLTPAGEAPSW